MSADAKSPGAKSRGAKPPRTLSREEKHLWEKVARSVQRRADDPVLATGTRTGFENLLSATGSVAAKDRASSPAPAYTPKNLPQQLRHAVSPAGLTVPASAPAKTIAGDPRLEKLVRRGRKPIDATLDLHGLTQIVAHERLKHFIGKAHGRGLHCVLVITGKGGKPLDRFQRQQTAAHSPVALDRPASRGVLRERFLTWVEQSPLREQITRVATAKNADGGAGAFYVFIKRARTPRPQSTD